MALAVEWQAGTAAGAGSGTLNPGLPADIRYNDVLVLFTGCNGGNNPASAENTDMVTVNPRWISLFQLRRASQNIACEAWFLPCRGFGLDTFNAITWTTGTGRIAQIVRLRGVDPTDLIDTIGPPIHTASAFDIRLGDMNASRRPKTENGCVIMFGFKNDDWTTTLWPGQVPINSVNELIGEPVANGNAGLVWYISQWKGQPQDYGAGTNNFIITVAGGAAAGSYGIAISFNRSGSYIPLEVVGSGGSIRGDLYFNYLDDTAKPVPPITNVLEMSYTRGLNQVGQFSLTIPALGSNYEGLKLGDSIRIFKENEGLQMIGNVETVVTDKDATGTFVRKLSGRSVFNRLANRVIGPGLEISAQAFTTFINNFMPPALAGRLGMTASFSSTFPAVTGKIPPMSYFAVMEAITNGYFGGNIREAETEAGAILEFGYFGTQRDIWIQSAAEFSKDMEREVYWNPATNTVIPGENPQYENYFPITGLTITDTIEDMITAMIPLGGTAINLQYSTRQQGDTNGELQIRDPNFGFISTMMMNLASVQQDYGRRETVQTMSNIQPIGTPSAAEESNRLYDAAEARMIKRRRPYRSFEVTTVGNMFGKFKPGDKIWARYNTPELKIPPTALWVMGYSRTVRGESDDWALILATEDRYLDSQVFDVESYKESLMFQTG